MSVVIAPVFEGVDVLHIERFAIEMNHLIEKHFANEPVTGVVKCKFADNECGNSAESWKKIYAADEVGSFSSAAQRTEPLK